MNPAPETSSSGDLKRLQRSQFQVALVLVLILVPWLTIIAGLLLALAKGLTGVSTTLVLAGFGLLLLRLVIFAAIGRRTHVSVRG